MGVEVGASKPSRSEDSAGLTPEEQAKHDLEVKVFLEATTPHRPLKPGRSEPSNVLEAYVSQNVSQSELNKFKELEVQDVEPLHTEGGTVNDDSYVETKYYDDLNSVDKTLHHETGTGFICPNQTGSRFTLGEDGENVFRTSTHTNPATNEWQPAPIEEGSSMRPNKPEVSFGSANGLWQADGSHLYDYYSRSSWY